MDLSIKEDVQERKQKTTRRKKNYDAYMKN